MLQLKYALTRIKYDIIGISDIRREGNSIIEDEDHVFCHIGETPGRYGVGFLIRKVMKPNIETFIGLSERVCLLKLKFDKCSLSIIQVYAPTAESTEEEINKFYSQIQEAQTYTGRNVIVMGDFNAKIGQPKNTEHLIMGKYGFGKRNARGEKLVKFALENNFTIANTIFKKDQKKRWTWVSPDRATKNEIDYILHNNHIKLQNVEVLINVPYSSDHRLLRATLLLKNYKKRRNNFNNAPAILKTEDDQNIYLNFLNENIKTLNDDDTAEVYFGKIQEAINNSLKETQQHSSNTNKKPEIISEESKLLIKERHDLQNKKTLSKKEKQHLKLLYKTTNKMIKRDYKNHRLKIIEEFLITKGSTKKANKILNREKIWIPNLKTNKKLNKTQTRTEITNIATEYYRKLYSAPKSEDKGAHSFVTLEAKDDQVDTNNTIDPITESEIMKYIMKLKPDKSPGPDNIANETIQQSRFVLIQPLTKLMNKILNEERIPNSWAISDIILLYKKGDPADVGNYRPISLMSNLYKLFASCLENRINTDVEKQQPIEQAGFRKGFSTVDHIHTMEQVIEKYEEFNRPLYLGFVDYTKAFDSIHHETIWDTLSTLKVPNTYINIIKDIYEKSVSRVKLDITGETIKICRGVRQGDPLSPRLFIAVLQYIMSKLEWQQMGICIDKKRFNHLRFADDIIVVSETAKQLETMLNDLHKVSSEVGLEMNTLKTKILTNRTKQLIKVNSKEIEYVDNYIYLGKQLSFSKNRNIEEIKRRINLTWNKYWSYKEIMKSKLPIKLKTKVMNTCLLPCLTYGCQTWIFNKKAKNSIQVCQRAMERSLLNLKLIFRQRNLIIRNRTQVIDALQHAQALKWRWAGHLMRTEDDRWTRTTTLWKGPPGKRRKGRPQERWQDDIVKMVGKEWTKKGKERNKWKLLEEAYTRQGVLS